MRLIYSVIICMVIAITSFGQTNWTGAIDSDWNNAGNWTMGVPISGASANILASGNDPVVSTPLTIDFVLQNFASITFDANVQNASTIANFGTATIINNAIFTNNTGQLITNNGTITNSNQFINTGTIQSNGTGVLNNTLAGIFNNSGGAAINNFATITNEGTFNNEGNISNCNIINNEGTFNNDGPLNQGANGVFNNLTNAILTNNNSISNSGDINNNTGATLINENTIQNNSDGTITNAGTLTNNQSINNAGLINNLGSFTNNDSYTNNFGANFINTSGEVLNNSCSTFIQLSGNPISCTTGCSFINNGTAYQIAGGGIINITGGTGLLLNDLGQQPSPTANCQDIIVILDAAGTATIDPLDIDDNSTAGYCTIADYQININSFTCDNVGPNVVTLTITDAEGGTDFCTATVTVIDGTAPVFTDCPQDMTINLDAGECEHIINFSDPVATDICGVTVVRTDNTGLNSGDAFPIGTTTIEYEATDGVNNTNCSFSITVDEFPNPTTALFCNGLEEVTLDENCEAYIGADDILEGGPYGCYNTYQVDLFFDIEMTMPVPTSPVVTSQNIDDTLYVMITEPIIGNNCWGSIYIKDRLAPQIVCEDLTITCLESSNPNVIGYPASSDNCDNGLFPTYEDEISGGACVDEIITRTWTVTDASGNSNTCQQTITIVRPDFNLLSFPVNLDNLSSPALNCADNPSTHPDATGWPTINGQIITNTCNFSSTYEDQVIAICEGTYDILRTWEVYDWCTSAVQTALQIIKVMDANGPVLTCPADIVTSTNQNSCIASVALPQPLINDACSNNFNTLITASAGNIYNNILTDLPIGTHTVTYTVTDDCGNQSNCSISITVTDQIAPVAICESTHTVGLTIDEPTLVPALAFDDGSYDNCSGLTYEVRRMDAPQCPGFDGTIFGAYVPFYCCDVTDVVMVELRVTDASGNSNSCMVEVIVEDKLNPAILCPPDITLTCYEDYNDLTLTGEAVASDNCSYTLSHIDDADVDNCGGGLVNRIWTATDPGGRTASCVQRIYIINDAAFYITDTACNNANPNDGVIWPCDYNSNTCAGGTDPSITGEPQIFEDGCDLVAVSHEDIVLPITGLACIKIIRVWTIHDWCQYDPVTGAGVWEYNQIIKILNTEAPEFTSDCEDQSFCSYEENCGDAPIQLMASATDDCTDIADLNFNYEIDLGNDGTVNYSGAGSDASGSYPLGTHKIKWFVEDGCGNVNTCTYLFVIADCKNPTAYCMNGIATELMPNVNEIEVLATAFDLGSFDNCGLDEFLIVSPSQGPGQNIPPAAASPSIIFDCTDVGTQTVDFWISDAFGNWGYCSTYIIIQDNMASCTPQSNAQVSGSIENESGEMLESVMVQIDGNAPGIPDPNLTDINGTYGFPDLPTGYNYTIQPQKDEDPMNGVSTFDLVLMTRHILEIQALNSPYKLIAADINSSGSISTFDLVMLRRLILQIDENFTANTSWRFVDADFVFPNANDPFASPFPEVYELNDLQQAMIGDFVAIKIGDVNGSAATNNFAGNADDRNMEEPLIFHAKDELLNPGRVYQIDFTAADIKEMSGYQFTLNFDTESLAFYNIIPGSLPGLSYGNFGLSKLSEGALTTSWNKDINIDALDPDAILFSFSFEAKANVYWSEAITISSRFTRAEAYHKNAELLNVVLAFEESEGAKNKFEIYPNQPNPFSQETLISFSLPEDTPLNFTIQDVSGKIVQTKDLEATAGYNEISITKNELHGPGVYFYTIKTKTHRVSLRMILIKE